MRKAIKIFMIFGLSIIYLNGFSQRDEKIPRYFDSPIIIDTTNTILIPTKYNTDFLSNNKIAFWNNYYANILITSTDNSEPRKLFETDTYIKPLIINNNDRYSYKLDYKHSKSIYNDWIFFLVKNNDLDKNKRIDEKDPTILYVADLNVNGIKKITNENENVIEYYVYENQNLVMIKIQRDLNKDQNFTDKDKDFYFLFMEYKTLKEIKRLEIE